MTAATIHELKNEHTATKASRINAIQALNNSHHGSGVAARLVCPDFETSMNRLRKPPQCQLLDP